MNLYMSLRIISFLFIAILSFGHSLSAECIDCPPIKLGATLPLSGKLAFVGNQERDAFLLAVEELNNRGGIKGRKIELIVEDNQGEAKTAVTGVSKLLNIDKVDVVLSMFTHITQAINDLVAKKQKVLIYASSNNSIAQGNPLFFKDHINHRDIGERTAIAIKEAGHKKISLLRETSDACIEISEAIEAGVKQYNIDVASVVEYLPGDVDFRTILLKLKASSPDAIAACTWRDVHLIMKQMSDIGMINVPTFHYLAPFLAEADTVEMLALYEKNGLVSTWYGFVETSRDPIQLEFMKDFKARYGYLPRADAGFAYDDIRILAKALNTCVSENAVDQNCLTKALLQTEHVGVSGKLKFNRSGLSLRETLLMKVENGQWKELSR